MTTRTRSQSKGDFISKMPDDVLLMILSLMPVKDAVVTGSLSMRWSDLWRNVIRLNFDGTEAFHKMASDKKLCVIERCKYVNQVYNVITSHTHPTVQDFRIRFDLDATESEEIDEWVEFALDKKVETLELDLLDKTYDIRDPDENYEFRLPSSISMLGEMLSLKNLFLKGVSLLGPTLNEILTISPHLEKLYMFGTDVYPCICFGGQGINLKHFKLVSCSGIESISLHGFDLVSFTYYGPEIELHLSDLPKLKEVVIGEVSVGLENNVFSQISSCALYLQALELDVRSPKKGLEVNAIIKLPNVKKLTLAMDAEEDDCLLEFTSIAQACPSLETFSIALHWFSPLKRRRKIRRVAAPHVHKHLKRLEMSGYYGRISDLELAVYVIDNAAALKKIVIDPCCQAFGGRLSKEDCLKRLPAARSSAKHQLTPLLPPGVDMEIL
ncbi:putative F-box domain, FBD domain, leucine-rich repeat domain superfamily [Helianthus anomalus]